MCIRIVKRKSAYDWEEMRKRTLKIMEVLRLTNRPRDKSFSPRKKKDPCVRTRRSPPITGRTTKVWDYIWPCNYHASDTSFFSLFFSNIRYWNAANAETKYLYTVLSPIQICDQPEFRSETVQVMRVQRRVKYYEYRINIGSCFLVEINGQSGTSENRLRQGS